MDLLEKLDKAILSILNTHRDYIGASSIGDECSLKIWKKFNGYQEEYTAEALRRFADGHAVEERIVSWLRLIPDIEIWTLDEFGKQFGFSALGGKYKGHYDGVIRIDGVLYLLEIKCSTKMSALKNLKEKYPEEYVLEKWNPDYYAQGMTYCKFAEIDKHLLICADAGGRNMVTVVTPYNEQYANALLEKAERIANATTPPQKNGGKNYFKCKMCPFYKECWDGN